MVNGRLTGQAPEDRSVCELHDSDECRTLEELARVGVGVHYTEAFVIC